MNPFDILSPVAMLTWHPSLSPVAGTVLIFALAAWLWLLYRRMATRLSKRKAALLLIPRAVIVLLLLIALFDPSWRTTTTLPGAGRIVALLDVSSSMDVKDDASATRLQRARRFLANLEKTLGRSFSLKTVEFDTSLHDKPSPPAAAPGPLRGTDIGACLLAVSQQTELSASAAVLLLTDGGDERMTGLTLPQSPLVIVGFGSDPKTWTDVSVDDLTYPPSVEKGTDFEIRADIVRRGAAPTSLTVRLEKEAQGKWARVEEKQADLSRNRARVTFRTSCADTGLQKFRAAIDPAPGELSPLNNAREFSIEVRRKSLHVLFFTRSLNSELKMIRSELAADPGIAFTALYRTIGERFTVQGDRVSGDEELSSGFPGRVEDLRLYDCIVVGSFASTEWTKEQMQALVKYVEAGGSVIFLGGDQAFGLGSYTATPLAALFPWTISADEPDMLRGTFPVTIPAASESHPIVGGVSRCMADAGHPAIESINSVGGLKPGAISLMNAIVGNRAVCVISVQRYGAGNALAIASNTLWKWARDPSPLKTAYGLFWRQAVRNLAGSQDTGRLVSVNWDKPSYRPGERATGDIRLVGVQRPEQIRLSAQLARDGQTLQLPVEPVQGQPGAYAVKPLFDRRGAYHLTLTVHQAETLLETYEKAFVVAPQLGEGARLELDQNFLVSLAEKGNGAYAYEADTQAVEQFLKARNVGRVIVTEESLVHGTPWLAVAFLVILAAEWTLRRALNLL